MGAPPLLRGFSHTSSRSEVKVGDNVPEETEGEEGSGVDDRAYDNAGEDRSVGDDDEEVDDEEEESEENDGEVEYTLKDRQDVRSNNPSFWTVIDHIF